MKIIEAMFEKPKDNKAKIKAIEEKVDIYFEKFGYKGQDSKQLRKIKSKKEQEVALNGLFANLIAAIGVLASLYSLSVVLVISFDLCNGVKLFNLLILFFIFCGNLCIILALMANSRFYVYRLTYCEDLFVEKMNKSQGKNKSKGELS